MSAHTQQASLLEARLQLYVLHDCSNYTSVSAIAIERAFSVDVGGHPVLRESCHPRADRPDRHAFHFLDRNACGQCNLDTCQLLATEHVKPSSFSPLAAAPVARSPLFISFRKSSLAFAACHISSVQKIHYFALGVVLGIAHHAQFVFLYFGHGRGAGQWPAWTTHWFGLTLCRSRPSDMPQASSPWVFLPDTTTNQPVAVVSNRGKALQDARRRVRIRDSVSVICYLAGARRRERLGPHFIQRECEFDWTYTLNAAAADGDSNNSRKKKAP